MLAYTLWLIQGLSKTHPGFDTDNFGSAANIEFTLWVFIMAFSGAAMYAVYAFVEIWWDRRERRRLGLLADPHDISTRAGDNGPDLH
jgi:hypothetical protein